MKTLTELRRELKKIGFKVTTIQLSWGPHAVYWHVATNTKLVGNVFTPTTLAKWTPLFDFLRAHAAEIKAIHEGPPKIHGLTCPGMPELVLSEST